MRAVRCAGWGGQRHREGAWEVVGRQAGGGTAASSMFGVPPSEPVVLASRHQTRSQRMPVRASASQCMPPLT